MPHHPDDDRYIHLPLIQEDPNPDRRKRRVVPPPAPNRGGRGQFGLSLRQRVQAIEEEARARPQPPAGIQPHLVFRVPVAPKASPGELAEQLQELGISVVGIERDGAIIAFRDDANLNDFCQAVDTYERGPRLNPRAGLPFTTTTWDVLEWVEADQMRLWGRSDRVGTRLSEAIGPQGRTIERSRLYVLDVELWHRGTRTLAQQALGELRRLIADNSTADERLCDDFVGDTLCLARVSVRGDKLNSILDLDVVAEVDLPPTPHFDAHSAKQMTRRDFPVPPRPPVGGPSVCTLDSGIASNHPLLANNVGRADAVLTTATSPSDANGHGTMVGGLAVFGDIRACYESGQFQSDITLYSARVLNDENRFDDERLIIHQMRQAIELFRAEPYNCRVFNLSVGEPESWLRNNTRQSIWAECLDLLTRELKVLIVVSAGNHNLGLGNNARDAEQALTEYPRYLLEPDCGLCAPATAAIAVTVGGVAQHVEPAVRRGMNAENAFRVVANPSEPTPTSRIGPGINDAVKPEFVAHAGNLCFDAFDPPVRRRRAKYLGVEMNVLLIRGKTVDEIVQAYRAVSRGEPKVRAFQAPYKCQLEPGTTALESSTLQRSEWSFQREGQDYGDSWYLLVRAERTWAPAEIIEQDFGLAVTLHANEPQLYNLVRQRVQVRIQQRARAQR